MQKPATAYMLISSKNDIDLLKHELTVYNAAKMKMIATLFTSRTVEYIDFKSLSSYVTEELISKLESQLNKHDKLIVTFSVSENDKRWNQSFKILTGQNEFYSLAANVIESRKYYEQLESIYNNDISENFNNLTLLFFSEDPYRRLNDLEIVDLIDFVDNNITSHTSSHNPFYEFTCVDLPVSRLQHIIDLYQLYEEIQKFRTDAEMSLINRQLSSCIELLNQAIKFQLVQDDTIPRLTKAMTEDLLKTIKHEVDVTVDEQIDMLNVYKGHYPMLYEQN